MPHQNIVLITGASRGIGAACARLVAARGMTVAINYNRGRDAAEELAGSIESDGGRAFAVQGDVGRESHVIRLFEQLDELPGKLTGLVNNAGVLGGHKRKLADLESSSIEALLRVNVIGPLLCSREAAKRMSTRNGGGGGSIVNVSSLGAVTGSPNAFVDYAASKGAVDTMTIGLAAELSTAGIRVNGVRPGMIDTEIHATAGMVDRVARFGHQMPLGRAGTAEEVAEAIVWLLSDKASYVTGALLDVTGGAR